MLFHYPFISIILQKMSLIEMLLLSSGSPQSFGVFAFKDINPNLFTILNVRYCPRLIVIVCNPVIPSF